MNEINQNNENLFNIDSKITVVNIDKHNTNLLIGTLNGKIYIFEI